MTDTTSCFHCGEPCPSPSPFQIRYREQQHPACCAGCQAVAETIISSGLESYYSQRTEAASRNEPLPAEIRAQLRLYDDDQLQQDFVEQLGSDEREAALILEGISCAACIWLNEQHLARLPGVLSVSINYSTHRARVRWNNTQVQLSSILEHITAIGYHAHPYNHQRADQQWQQERKSALLRLWVAGLSMMQVMMFVVPIYTSAAGEIDAQWLHLLHWGSLLLTLPVVLYSCWPFYQNSWRELRHGRAGMDLPVSIGVLVAFFASLYALITGHGDIYFDSVSMFVFLLLGGRYLEFKARRKAGAAAEMLVKLVPAFAHRLTATGQLEEVAVYQLQAGEQIVVKAGETIPVDGMVLHGESECNEAMLSGESRPVAKTAGANVIAGSQNLHSALTVAVSQVGSQTRLGHMVRLLDQATQQKPRLAQLADRIAGYFIVILLLIAAGCYLYWHIHDPQHALPYTVAVLVISCPCALSLATPAALTAATGHLAQLGLLTTRGNSLEQLASITDIVFDKTGTLTHGTPRLIHTQVRHGCETAALAIAAALESHSEHPIASAFALPAQEPALPVHEFHNHPGGGLSGQVQGQHYWIGSPRFIAAQTGLSTADLSDSATTQIVLATPNTIVAVFELADQLRDTSAQTIKALQTAGYRVHLLSGDAPAIVQQVAQQLGIAQQQGGAQPADKLRYIQALQAKEHRVLMLGDGVNDAPVLALANVSVAMGAGVDIAQAAGDMVLLNNELAILPPALQLARKTRQIIRQNLAWALLYNLAALPLAVAGYVTPWLASLGMALSSLLVVSNALRLVRPNSAKKIE
ncbi:heavy metal translocating P-type ATPase [Chitinibacter tainanensis]|uniref:heavy metal translocating P-type ATPase n=1 Tax=Chitinibacter tainanensis TaxID=230667 RepID=UPI000407707A|nr:heavy metal translocating P-type ATPase [Chitinibacter tainanensis]